MKLLIPFLSLLILFLGLNYRQLYSVWAIKSETKRLTNLAENAPNEFQNPPLVEDDFDEKLSSDFWKFFIINGAGKVSNESAWHSAALTFDQGLTIGHFADPEFKNESADLMHQPAAGRYNNVTLISGSAFRPTPSKDVVLRFTSKVSENFYGTAGVIFQPVDTLRKDGLFVKPFDMFGFSVAGEESSITGKNGSLCYLALNWIPVQVEALNVDAYTWHEYEIRLSWISNTEWLGTVMVNNIVKCQMPIPTLGPVEVHVWSDNSLVISRLHRWWEIAPVMDLKFQDGGDKQFHLGIIRIFEETR